MISFLLYAVGCVLLAIYSYGFLDFNLTLTSYPLFLRFVTPLQHLVYFDRPLSAKIYVSLLFIMFALYTAILQYCKTSKSAIFPWKFFLIIILILTLAYPMLSYDVFNYMFHSKILWFYHQNPHLHAPLEYTGDLWLRFMRWVHTSSAYGPVFTAIESPAYLLGIGKFVPVLYLMKLTMSAFFVWCVYLIGKLTRAMGFTQANSTYAQLLLAFNPFIIMEVVVNGHNDAVMIALFLLSLYYSLKSKLIPSFISLLASIGTKFVTALTLPMYWIKNPKLKVLFSSLVLLLPVLVSPVRFQPWYLVWAIIPMVLIEYALARTWVIFASIAALIYYIPYIATGFWDNSLLFVSCVIYLPLVLSLALTRLAKLKL